MTGARNSISGSPGSAPVAIASPSKVSRTWASGSVKALMISSQPRSGRSCSCLLEDGAGSRQPSALTAQWPRTFPVTQASVRARPAAMCWRSRR